jgi:hypothetical protein
VVERSSTTTTLTAPGAVAAQTRLRALTLQIEFVLRYTTDLEWWLPQMAHGLENHWIAGISIYASNRSSGHAPCCACASTGPPTMPSAAAAGSW